MCALLSLSLNNTRYLARDKCLNRRTDGPRVPWYSYISLHGSSVSPHKGSASLLSFLPSFFSSFLFPSLLSGTRQVSLCHLSHGAAIHLEELSGNGYTGSLLLIALQIKKYPISGGRQVRAPASGNNILESKPDSESVAMLSLYRNTFQLLGLIVFYMVLQFFLEYFQFLYKCSNRQNINRQQN